MLDKLIANIKQSLTGKKESVDEESTEHSEELHSDSHDTSDNESGNSAEDKKKKQISMIIRVIVVIGLGYLALTEFVFKDDNNEVPAVAIKPHKPRKKAPPVTTGATDNAKPAEAKPVEAAAEAKPEVKQEEVKPVETKPVEIQPPVENINIAEKKPEEKPEEKPVDNAPVVAAPVETAQVGEVKTSENQIDKKIDSLIDSVDKKENSSEEAPKKAETKMEDKIVADDVYTPPPAYDQMGRGLVYNCKEKYWVCVDKISYIACNKNMKYNKSHGKAAECAVSNVYNSDDDCGVVQKYNVSTNKSTDFCQ